MKLEYDGTAFHGWQVQPRLRTVQGVIEEAMARMMESPVKVIGSGRTDAGVHALGQVAHCDVPKSIPPDRVWLGLNGLLPKDVRVLECETAGNGFHAQYSARGKLYRYDILNSEVPTALLRNRVWSIRNPLNAGLMSEGASHLRGKKDFAAFKSAGDETSTIRDLRTLDIQRHGDMITMAFEGDGFLKHMVRNMVGPLVEVGSGRMDPSGIGALLDSRSRENAPKKAPPQGLYLEKVIY